MNGENNKRRLMHGRWQYGVPAILLHWILALLVVVMAALGWTMLAFEDSPGSSWYFDLHKSLGMIVAGLVLLRWLWRIGHRPGPLPAQVPVLQARVAVLTHWLMYVCLFLMPISGLAGAAFSKSGLIFFGHSLTRLVAPDHALSERFFALHGIVIWVLTGLVVLHVLAALRHLLFHRDGVFQRMWF